MQWVWDNAVALATGALAAVMGFIGFLWRLDKRTRDNARDIEMLASKHAKDMEDLQSDLSEAKSARMELSQAMTNQGAWLRKVAEDTAYIRGKLNSEE